MYGEQSTAVQGAETKVWDPLLRVFHWGLVLSFAIAFISAEEWDDLHIWAGYAVAALIAFRLIWGVVGPRPARFMRFMVGPSGVATYAKQMLAGKAPRYLGHNPLGAAMILILILSLAIISMTGWMMTLDQYWGVEWVEDVHEVIANLMLVLIALHVCGVIISGLSHGENLERAMVTGRKRALSGHDVDV